MCSYEAPSRPTDLVPEVVHLVAAYVNGEKGRSEGGEDSWDKFMDLNLRVVAAVRGNGWPKVGVIGRGRVGEGVGPARATSHRHHHWIRYFFFASCQSLVRASGRTGARTEEMGWLRLPAARSDWGGWEEASSRDEELRGGGSRQRRVDLVQRRWEDSGAAVRSRERTGGRRAEVAGDIAVRDVEIGGKGGRRGEKPE